MSFSVYANQEPLEGTVDTSGITHTLVRPSRVVEIINDSGTRELQFRYNSSEGWATLRPLEAISAHIRTREIYIRAATGTIAYRIRVLG